MRKKDFGFECEFFDVNIEMFLFKSNADKLVTISALLHPVSLVDINSVSKCSGTNMNHHIKWNTNQLNKFQAIRSTEHILKKIKSTFTVKYNFYILST